MHKYFISFEANRIDYEKTVKHFTSVGFHTTDTYESVLDTLFFSIMKKDNIQIKVIDDYDFNYVCIESNILISEAYIKGLSVLKRIDY